MLIHQHVLFGVEREDTEIVVLSPVINLEVFMKLFLLVGSLLLAACAANPNSSSPSNQELQAAPPVVADAKVVQEKDKVRCTQEKTTGSNLRKKMCITDSQRDELQEKSRELMRDVQAQGAKLPVKN